MSEFTLGVGCVSDVTMHTRHYVTQAVPVETQVYVPIIPSPTQLRCPECILQHTGNKQLNIFT